MPLRLPFPISRRRFLATARNVAAFSDTLAARAQQLDDEVGRFVETVRAA
jgi:hypothetical protein